LARHSFHPDSRPLMLTRKIIAWALYDWANSAFALSVLAVLFPIFLGSYWSAGDAGAAVTARLGLITAAAALLVSLIAPILGAIADSGGYRKRFLLVFAFLGASTTALLAVPGAGQWPWALALYLFASIGFYGSTVFYDSMLIDVAPSHRFDVVSTLGFSLGYLGGALLLALHVWMLYAPQTFGLQGTESVIKFAFVSVGAWWAVFLVPLIVFVPETKVAVPVSRGILRLAFAKLLETVSHVRGYRNIVRFLFAYWIYLAGVFTVISMAANYGQRLGFGDTDLVTAFMITNLAGFPATLLYGFLGQRYGARRGIYLALAVYVAVSSWAIFMTEIRQFYVLAVIVGCIQGGVQGLSRSFYAALIPHDRPGEFFGFYNMVTKFSHVVGPMLVGLAALLSDEPGVILAVLIPLFIIGGLLLSLVKLPELPLKS
ncbi:MAG: MFS transporter, partial [Gammaproteobacteria bacterium]|nr:MFS transporter [Gammaproteobacteria bacterium]